MPKAKPVSHSSAELKAMRDRSDWKRVHEMTDAELTANAKSDSDNPPLTKGDFEHAVKVVRGRPAKAEADRKQPVTIRLSPEVLAHYKATGRGWQSRIDADLKKHALGK